VKIKELIKEDDSNDISPLLIEDEFISEMGNLIADFTEIPGNITLWTRPQPDELPHNKYRIKVFKDRAHICTFTIGKNPKLVETFPRLGKLDSFEEIETKKFISDFSSLLIQYVDDKITLSKLKVDVQRERQRREL